MAEVQTIPNTFDNNNISPHLDPSIKVQLQCSLCASFDVSNVLTTCLHLICRDCSDSIKVDTLYCCPTCKEYSEKVICNTNLSNSDNTTNLPCNWCEDNGEHTKSIGNCEECGIWLCAECLKGHNRMPPLRNHTIVMSQKNKHQGTLHCESHPNEMLECFCEACGVLTCRDCQLSIHRDHGSHRWVGEKADLMKISMEYAIKELCDFQTKLIFVQDFAHKAKVDTSEDSLVSSIEKTRQDIESRTESLINIIRAQSETLLGDLDRRANQSFSKLTHTETLIQNLQTHLTHIIMFASQLTQSVSNDPASLVQLFDLLKNRIAILQERVKQIIEDKPLSLSNPEDNSSHSSTFIDSRKNIIGWCKTLNTRALFLGNLDSSGLSRFSGSVVWLPKQTSFNLQNNKEKSDYSLASIDKGLENMSECLPDETNDFLDSLAEIDNNSWILENGLSEPPVTSVGCAICFGVGLLAHCGKCCRAYHLDCHLPRLCETSMSPGWVCGLCADEEETMAPVEKLNESVLSYKDYLAGCRILMGLLVHEEAVHFTASVCPVCSLPLLISEQPIPPCPAGHLYHRLAELRVQLDETVLDPIIELTDPDSGVVLKRNGITCLNDWLVEVDKFWVDVANEANIRGATKGCIRAAQRLRSHFNTLVRQYMPQLELSLSNPVCGNVDSEMTSKCNVSFSPENGDYDLHMNIPILPAMTRLESN